MDGVVVVVEEMDGMDRRVECWGRGKVRRAGQAGKVGVSVGIYCKCASGKPSYAVPRGQGALAVPSHGIKVSPRAWVQLLQRPAAWLARPPMIGRMRLLGGARDMSGAGCGQACCPCRTRRSSRARW